MTTPKADRALLCPSARPDDPDARAFAVVDRSQSTPRLAYLDRARVLDERVQAALGDAPVGEVLRMTSRCAGSGCGHYDGARCTLGDRLVRLTASPSTDTRVPLCAIRSACRWFHEQGVEACVRCQWVISDSDDLFDSSALRREVAAQGVRSDRCPN